MGIENTQGNYKAFKAECKIIWIWGFRIFQVNINLFQDNFLGLAFAVKRQPLLSSNHLNHTYAEANPYCLP